MKKIIVLIFMGGLVSVLAGCKQVKETIFTGFPNQQDEYYQPFIKDIKKLNQNLESEKVDYGDIWIKDVAPVVTDRLVKFAYSPNYLPKKQSQKTQADFKNWLDKNEFNYQQSPIILDGGNFVYNMKGTALITKRILKDNPSYGKDELIRELKEILHIEKIILIDEEPGDVLGHADGQVHFIQPNVLFVGDFEGRETVKKQIEQAAPEIDMIDLPSNYQEAGQYDENIPSAKGLYINMMETEKNVYVPKYGLKTDKKVIDLVSKYTEKNVYSVNVKNLSTLGGSVNCLTWYCPQNLLPEKAEFFCY
ncbi:agmatine deiminase family protein [Enterococcus devriesei]|uniref:agmatine deiminase family protein n=1 Tax=Enterococcus devriesei TaxID=319970 RepID=UPI0036D291E4